VPFTVVLERRAASSALAAKTRRFRLLETENATLGLGGPGRVVEFHDQRLQEREGPPQTDIPSPLTELYEHRLQLSEGSL
jgi:hypothetical protein